MEQLLSRELLPMLAEARAYTLLALDRHSESMLKSLHPFCTSIMLVRARRSPLQLKQKKKRPAKWRKGSTCSDGSLGMMGMESTLSEVP